MAQKHAAHETRFNVVETEVSSVYTGLRILTFALRKSPQSNVRCAGKSLWCVAGEKYAAEASKRNKSSLEPRGAKQT